MRVSPLLIAQIAWLSASFPLAAQNSQLNLPEVAEFSASFCGEYFDGKTESKKVLDFAGQAKIKGFFKQVIDLGIDGDADIMSNSAIGLIDELLVADRGSVRDCKLAIWSDLRNLVGQFDEKIIVQAEHRSAEQMLKAIKGEVYTIIDGKVEVIVKKVAQNGFTIERPYYAIVEVHPPKVRPYKFNPFNKGKTKKFEYRGNIYRMRMVDVDIYEETATIDIVKID